MIANLIEFLLYGQKDDWNVFLAAVRAWMHGVNPYTLPPVGLPDGRFFNPPWLLPLLTPIALLPSLWQNVALLVFTYTAAILVARHFRLRGLRLVAALASPVIFYEVVAGNVDWLVLLGLIAPPPLALVLLAIKPQTTWVLMLLIVLRVWRKDGWRKAALTMAPLALLGALWLVFYGLPSMPKSGNIGNRSLWPYGLLLGVPVGALALHKDSTRLALLAGPFLTPYCSVGGYLGAVLAFPILSWVVVLGLALTGHG